MGFALAAMLATGRFLILTQGFRTFLDVSLSEGSGKEHFLALLLGPHWPLRVGIMQQNEDWKLCASQTKRAGRHLPEPAAGSVPCSSLGPAKEKSLRDSFCDYKPLSFAYHPPLPDLQITCLCRKHHTYPGGKWVGHCSWVTMVSCTYWPSTGFICLV